MAERFPCPQAGQRVVKLRVHNLSHVHCVPSTIARRNRRRSPQSGLWANCAQTGLRKAIFMNISLAAFDRHFFWVLILPVLGANRTLSQ